MREPAVRIGLALAALAAAGCGAASPRPVQLRSTPGALPGTRLDEEALDARALASEAAFHFPDETRALLRGLLRSEFARREAARLGLSPDRGELERALGEAVANIEATLGPDGSFEDWARERYGRSGREVEAAIQRRIEDNQLYQLALRTEAALQGGYDLHILSTLDEEQAAAWARQLRAGASPVTLAPLSVDPGPAGDAGFRVSAALPAPLGEGLRNAAPGDVVGPFRFAGDQLWRVARLRARIEPRAAPPPGVLLEELRKRPIHALEARAWFEEMLRRYTASERLPEIQAPVDAFVPLESR